MFRGVYRELNPGADELAGQALATRSPTVWVVDTCPFLGPTRYVRVHFDGGRCTETGEASSGWLLEAADTLDEHTQHPLWHPVAKVGIYIGRRTVPEAELCAASEALKAACAWLRGRLRAELLGTGFFR